MLKIAVIVALTTPPDVTATGVWCSNESASEAAHFARLQAFEIMDKYCVDNQFTGVSQTWYQPQICETHEEWWTCSVIAHGTCFIGKTE